MGKVITKKIDNLGRITIPKFFRDLLELELGEEIEIFTVDENTIGIRKAGNTEI